MITHGPKADPITTPPRNAVGGWKESVLLAKVLAMDLQLIRRNQPLAACVLPKRRSWLRIDINI